MLKTLPCPACGGVEDVRVDIVVEQRYYYRSVAVVQLEHTYDDVKCRYVCMECGTELRCLTCVELDFLQNLFKQQGLKW